MHAQLPITELQLQQHHHLWVRLELFHGLPQQWRLLGRPAVEYIVRPQLAPLVQLLPRTLLHALSLLHPFRFISPLIRYLAPRRRFCIGLPPVSHLLKYIALLVQIDCSTLPPSLLT
jgi:hypothetical protein